MNEIEYSHASKYWDSQNEPRDKMQALWRGARQKCPNCGDGPVFSSFLKVAGNCKNCGEDLHHQRSDDAAPYFTIFIVGHIIVPLILMLEIYVFPPVWVYGVVFIPLVIALTLLILPRVKGAVVAFQWALYMHGFDKNEPAEPASHFDPEMTG